MQRSSSTAHSKLPGRASSTGAVDWRPKHTGVSDFCSEWLSTWKKNTTADYVPGSNGQLTTPRRSTMRPTSWPNISCPTFDFNAEVTHHLTLRHTTISLRRDLAP